MQTRVQPIDEFIFQGVAQKMTQQFQGTAVYVTSPDKVRALQTVTGKTPEYPFIFLNVQTWSAASDRYNSVKMSRTGLHVKTTTDGGQFLTVRVLPVNFEVEVTFITNAYDGVEGKSAKEFARRWLLVRRNGALGFTVNYGMMNFPITMVLNESVSLPNRETPTDQEATYSPTSTLTVQGYISEPVLGRKGRIQDIILSEEVPPITPGATFYSFK